MFLSSIDRIVQMNTPYRLREPVFLSWLKTSVAYLVKIIADLNVLWEQTIIEVMTTPQILYLEHYLNNRFTRVDIFISEGYDLGPWFFNTYVEGDPEFYWDIANENWLWGNNDADTTDFVVNIPSILADQVQLIAACVQKYKLPGMRFIIQIF